MNSKIINHNIILLLILSMALFGCQVKEKASIEKQQTIPVKAMKVELMYLLNKLEYTGNIKAQDEAIVYPKVSGKVIEKVREDGSVVNKGDVIAYIDRDEVGLQFEKAPVESPIR